MDICSRKLVCFYPDPSHKCPRRRLVAMETQENIQELNPESKDTGRIVMRNSGFGLVSQLAVKALSFAFSVLIIRRLGSSDFGYYSAIIAFTTAFAFISDMGLGIYTVREVARFRTEKDAFPKINQLYSDVLWLRMGLAVVAIVVIGIAAVLFRQPMFLLGAILLNSVSLMLYAVQGASDAVLGGYERLDISSTGKVINQLLFVVLGGAALFAGLGYYGLVAASLVGVFGLMLFCWRAVVRLGVRLQKPLTERWLSLLKASLPFGIISLALGLSYKFDTILLTAFRTSDEVGYYNSAYNLVFSAVLIANVVNSSLYPTLSRRSVDSGANLTSMYSQVIRYLLVISLPIAVGGALTAHLFIPLLYKEAFANAVPAFHILVWVIPLMFLTDFLGYVVIIGNHESMVARAVVISTLINIAFNAILVPRYGLLAASVMTVLTEAVLISQYIWYIRRLVQGINWLGAVIPPFLAAALMGGVVFFLLPHLDLIPLVLAGAASYLLFAALFRAVRQDDVRFFLSLVRRKGA